MKTSRSVLAVIAAVAVSGMIATQVFAASGPGLNMAAGETDHVTCGGPSLSVSGQTGTGLDLSCADNPTTTTTVPDTTTTVPVTTTTVPVTTTTVPSPPTTIPTGTPGCGLSQVAFCDTFDNPTVNGAANSRAGQLDGNVWGVSRVTGNQNLSSPANGWGSAQLSSCGSTATVNPPADVQVCNGQLVDTVNDAGSVTSLSTYPKQPFDFAGRTGTVVFDVSNDSAGSHAAWPELWVTDQPIPTPFTHEGSFLSVPRNGFGIRFAGCNQGACPHGAGYVGVDSAITVSNYVESDTFDAPNPTGLQVIGIGDVKEAGSGQINHYQVQVSQGQIDVYGTDAFTPGSTIPSLVHIATIPNANLSFTRGLVYIEDAHYNGDKFNSQGTHAFTWDNVGFDGPLLPRDLTFDVPDNTRPDNGLNFGFSSGTDLGYNVGGNSSLTLPVPAVTGLAQASGALLTFGFYHQTAPITLTVAVNGHTISVPWPYADSNAYTDRTLAVPVPLADVVAGNNTVTFTTGNYGLNVFNIDLIMQGAGGTVPPA